MYIYPMWWLCVVAWIFSLIPAVFGYVASLTGRFPWVSGTSFASLLNVFAAIAVLCVVMTDIANSNCNRVACDRDSDLKYLQYLYEKRAIATAIVSTYAIACIICYGVVMVYSFFLSRRFRRQPANWLTSNMNKRVSIRATATGTGPAASIAPSAIV